MYKYIILDFNGTLLDDCDVCLKILNYLTKEYHLGHVSKEHYMDIFTFPVSEYYRALGFDVDNGKFAPIGNKFHAYYNKMSYEEAELFDDVIPTLEKLKKDYKLVCLSASMLETLNKQLTFYHIISYFDFIVGLTDNLAVSKKDAAINFMEKEEINPEECLFIGDSIHDLEVANEIKTDCYLVATGHTSKERLLKATPKVIDKLSDIFKIINN